MGEESFVVGPIFHHIIGAQSKTEFTSARQYLARSLLDGDKVRTEFIGYVPRVMAPKKVARHQFPIAGHYFNHELLGDTKLPESVA